MIILIDDREKRPWQFPGVETKEARLETGDYTVEGYEDRFAVERKSLNDLATSMGNGRDRFEAEIQRAQDFDEFAVVVEGSREDAKRGEYYSQIHPNAVIGTAEKWPLRYGILDFVWAGEDEDGEKVRSLPAARDHAPQECLRLLDRWYLKAASDLF